MMTKDSVRIGLVSLAMASVCASGWAQNNVIPVHEAQETGQSVTPAFEGWFPNDDGSFSILFGYYNRNTKEIIDVPVGPMNHIDPGGPDYGQPTHFLPRRQWGVFTIKVPKDFGGKKLTWTIVANGQETKVPGTLDPLWQVSPYVDATENTPPYVGFAAGGPFAHGPAGPLKSVTAKVGEPVTLALWVADDANLVEGASRPRGTPVTVTWEKFRGPGEVVFEKDKPAVEEAAFARPPKATFTGMATTTATFGEPGEYVVRAVANDWSGDGGRGFQCCWSNAEVKVTVSK